MTRPDPGPDPGPVVVALSGGVDSAVAAWRLLEAGHAVRALFMKNWEEDDRDGACAAAADLSDARAVCDRLGIELATVNLSAEYWDRVFTPFLEGYRSGRTPNPDVECNRAIKFDAFLDFALERGAGAIATGHYARVDRDADGRLCLLKGRDSGKDQSYFLHALDQAQLGRALFPIGGLAKEEVRRLARRLALPVADKRDSTGLCFVGKRPFRAFLSRYLPPCPGPIETPEGEVVGRHQGLALYTLGQRQGLGIGGRRGRRSVPWYVVGKDRARNALIVAEGRDHPRLWSQALDARACTWVAGEASAGAFRCRARVRYRQTEQPCAVRIDPQGRCRVDFDAPQWAVTPGQHVVFYRGDVCLGGAVIERAH